MAEVVEFNLPPDCKLVGSVTVASYILSNGEMGYGVFNRGEMNLSSTLGMLELGKHVLLSEVNDEPEDGANANNNQ
jgi:hypothetical protein